MYPTDVPTVFHRWRREVERSASDGPWVGDAKRAALMHVFYADRREQWWLMDESTGLCCLAREPKLPSGQAERLRRLRADLSSMTLPNHIATRILGLGTAPETPTTWLPTCEVIPMNAISRYPLSILPPYPRPTR